MLENLRNAIENLKGYQFSEIQINKNSDSMQILFSEVISKMSPLLGNLTELLVAQKLNKINPEMSPWERQDPDFPDVISSKDPSVGIEVKVWYPYATEITGRFKESQNYLSNKNIYLALLAWDFTRLKSKTNDSEQWMVPTILDSCLIDCTEIAISRDEHYHKPPRYIVIEPLDTSKRTRNLQQRNVEGYRLQSNLESANESMLNIKLNPKYQSSIEYQKKVLQLQSENRYRLDTNFAKLDRIQNINVESFKNRVINQLEGKNDA